MNAPGVYPGLTMAEYLATPAVSSGVINAMVERCPAAAWYCSYLNPNRVDDPSKESDAGTIAHSIVLEGSADRVCVIDPFDYPAERTGNIPDGFTNKAIKAARDSARAAGQIPVLKSDWARIEAMADSAMKFIASLRTTEPAIWQAFQTGCGDSELTCIWDDGGTRCRLRADRISEDRALVCDLKFTATSAHPDAFGRAMLSRMGYATAAGFYRRGIKATFGTDAAIVYLVTEQEAPFLSSLIGLDPAWLEYGNSRARNGLKRWQECVRMNAWPAYPTRVCYPEIPSWLMAQMEEHEMAETPGGIPYDVSKLFKKSEAA